MSISGLLARGSPGGEARPAGVAPPRIALFVFALALLTHLGALGSGFVYDDVPIVVENPLVASLDRAPQWFASAYWPGHDLYYRPLVIASFALERAAFGVDARASHAVNLFCHALVSALVSILAGRLAWHQARGTTMLVAGSLFAVHPLLTEPVYWISARADLLATLALVLSLLSSRTGARGAIPTGAIVLAGILSKETVAIAPVVIALDALWRHRFAPDRPALRRAAPHVVAALIGLALAGAFRLVAFDGALWSAASVEVVDAHLHNPLEGAGANARVFTPIAILGFVFARSLWPWRLSSDYAADTLPLATTLTDVRVVAGLALLAVCVVGFTASLRRRGHVAWALGFAMLAWLPASNTMALGGALFGERFLYAPAAGIAILAGLGGAALWTRITRPAMRATLGIAFVAALSLCVARDVARMGDWRSNATLYASVVEAYPRNAQGHYNLGSLALEDARARELSDPEREALLAEAAMRFARAADIHPGYVLAVMNGGVVHAERGEWARAREAFEAAEALHAEDARVQYNLALANERLDDRERAILHYRRSAALVPGGGPAGAALGRLIGSGDTGAP